MTQIPFPTFIVETKLKTKFIYNRTKLNEMFALFGRDEFLNLKKNENDFAVSFGNQDFQQGITLQEYFDINKYEL